jgi:hypothetical protein
MGLTQRLHVLNERLWVAQLGDCGPHRFFFRRAACAQLVQSLIEVLGHLLDDVGLPFRAEP